jgi:5-enolpyruvylshikimate-3-phosphate synthase
LAALANGTTVIHNIKASPEITAFADYLSEMGASINVKNDQWEIEGTNFKYKKTLSLEWIGDALPWQKRNKKIIECLLEGNPFYSEEKIAVNDSLIRELASFGAELEWKLDGPDENDELAKRMARAQGIKNERKWICNIPPVRSLLARDRFIAGSVSQAAFLALTASIIPDSEITIKAVSLDASRAGIFGALKRLGANIEVQSRHERGSDVWGDLRVKSASNLAGRRLSADTLATCIDEVPFIATMACFAEGETILKLPAYAAQHCKPVLESLYENLKNAEIECGIYDDGFILRGTQEINPKHLDCKNNTIMGLALHALNKRTKGKENVVGIECVENVYPGILQP